MAIGVGFELKRFSFPLVKQWRDNSRRLTFSGGPKYEEVYIRAYEAGWPGEVSLARFIWRHCHIRSHR